MNEKLAGEAVHRPENSAETPSQGPNAASDRHAGPTDLTGIFKQVTIRESTQRAGAEHSAGVELRSHPPQGTGPAYAAHAEPHKRPADEEMGFTQMFQSLQGNVSSEPHCADWNQPHRHAPGAHPAGGATFSAQEASAGDNWTSSNNPGEFTQMFQRLAETRHMPERSAPPSYYTGPSSPEPAQMGGGFTQLLRTLSYEGTPEFPLEESAPPRVQPTPQGQGEFTRIVSRSAMREAMLREEQQRNHSPAPQEPSASAPDPQRTSDLPQQFVSAVAAMPPLPGSTPPLPPPGLPPAMASFPFPLAPSSAQVLPPSASGRLQEYVPLLLIANLFLTLLTLIIVAVALSHQH
jgi:hypothetical protein